MIEEKEYYVELTIKARTLIRFSTMERERPITKLDAINNAIGSLFVEEMEQEFQNLGFAMSPIEGVVIE